MFFRVTDRIFLVTSQNGVTVSNPVVLGSRLMDILKVSDGEYDLKDEVVGVGRGVASMSLHNLLKSL